MKCANCGAELKVGCIYCSVCGKEAQIVPDYNLLEDDYLREMLKEEKKTKSQRKKNKESQKKKSRKGIIAAAISAVTVMAAGAAAVWISYSHNNSVSWQIEKAEEKKKDKEFGEAIPYLERALELEEANTDAWMMLAEAYQETGETDDAIEVCRKVLQSEPDRAEAYEMLITLYEGLKDYEAIQELGEQVEEESLRQLFSDYLVEEPVFSLEPGVYHEECDLEISGISGSTVYYTLDGSPPQRGTVYSEPLHLGEGLVTLRAVSKNELGLYSDEIIGTYKIQFKAPEKPRIFPRGGDFDAPQPITVEVPEGCSAYYTWDGTVPTANSEKYTGPLEMPEGNNILSLILIDGHNLCSEVLKCNYIYIP